MCISHKLARGHAALVSDPIQSLQVRQPGNFQEPARAETHAQQHKPRRCQRQASSRSDRRSGRSDAQLAIAAIALLMCAPHDWNANLLAISSQRHSERFAEYCSAHASVGAPHDRDAVLPPRHATVNQGGNRVGVHDVLLVC